MDIHSGQVLVLLATTLLVLVVVFFFWGALLFGPVQDDMSRASLGRPTFFRAALVAREENIVLVRAATGAGFPILCTCPSCV